MKLRDLAIVTRFEFSRHFSFKGELIGLALILIVVAFKFGGQKLMERANHDDPVRIGVVVQSTDEPLPADIGRVSFEPVDGRVALSAGSLKARGLKGVVHYEPDGTFTAVSAARDGLPEAVQEALNHVARNRKLAEKGLGAQDLEEISRPAVLHYQDLAGRELDDGRATRALGVVVTSLSLFACIGSFGLLFQTISGEKSQRVSEVVLSCIPAQTWIDGKVLAISLIGLKTVILYGLYLAIASALLTDNANGAQATQALSVSRIAWTAAFSLAGLLLWNSFFAALAASTSGEYGSGRRALFLLPMSLYLVCFAGIDNPENWFMKALSFFPGSSMIAMPLRILTGQVPGWQIVLSLALLVAGVWAMRSLAGGIFRVGMLMYGKPLSVAAILRLARQRGGTVVSEFT